MKSLKLLPDTSRFLPISRAECVDRGWLPPDGVDAGDEHGVDFVFVSGDAYVDHPSFANAILPRMLEAEGYRVAILPQPNWASVDDFRRFGRPRLGWLVSSGNLDSMLNNYTAHKRPRSDDTYASGGEGGRRPDYATMVYTQRCREAYKGVPVVIGGVEASMRRVAHYDYWSDKVRRSMLLDARADLLVYGMGEVALKAIARRLHDGEDISTIRDLPGTGYFIGKKGKPHFAAADDDDWREHLPKNVTELPAFEAVRGNDDESKRLFAQAAHTFHLEQNPHRSPILLQRHGDLTVVINPPQRPMTTEELDAVFALPYQRLPHPAYPDPIPAYEMVRFSVNVMRGCFGGCTFCAITEHQGKKIQSRSKESVLDEVRAMRDLPGFTGVLSDLGGPTANMYRMTCSDPKAEAVCRRPSCVHPSVCSKLTTDHTPIKELMREVRNVDGVKKVLIASGVRMDLANLDPEYVDELAAHHVGGHLKVAPEHVDDATLHLMKKPGVDVYVKFEELFAKASEKAGKEQYLVPYFVSSHPGCDVDGAVDLAMFLKERNLRPRQVQDFIPTPSTPATCMWWTGVDPMSMKPVFVEHKMRNKRKQKALMQYFLPDNSQLVREALRDAGREDLIGYGDGKLVAAYDKKNGGGGRGGKASSVRAAKPWEGGKPKRGRGRGKGPRKQP